MRLGDDQRWGEADDVPLGWLGNQTVLHKPISEPVSVVTLDKLDADEETLASDVLDDAVVGQSASQTRNKVISHNC